MPETYEALVILILFGLPGFVIGKVFIEKSAYRAAVLTDVIFATIYFSVVNHTLFSWWSKTIYEFYKAGSLFSSEFWQFIAWFFIVILISPVLIGLFFSWLTQFPRVNKFLSLVGLSFEQRSPESWDYFFQKKDENGDRESFYVIVKLKNGETIGGLYGQNSFVSFSPNPHDIYIEQVYNFDDGYFSLEPVTQTRGILIRREDVAYIKFFGGEQTT